MASASAKRADVIAFTRTRFGKAPVRVYIDRTGRMAKAFDASYHPLHRFTDAAGMLTPTPPAGYPYG